MLCLQSSEHLVENRAVESFLVLEVVIQQRLVDSGSARDGVSAGPGHAFTGKFADRGLQDGGPAFFGRPREPRRDLEVWFSWRSLTLINQLVR